MPLRSLTIKRRKKDSFFSDEDAPASIAVVFDTSGSMSGSKIAELKKLSLISSRRA